MNKPLLSICIPTRNRAKLLEYCVGNLRALDGMDIDYEIVIVDHASTDDTPKVIKAMQKRWDNIRAYRQQHDVGIHRQFCSALRAGRGQFTTYVADDDKIVPEKLVEYVKAMEADEAISVTFAPWLAYDDAKGEVLHGYFEVPERTVFTAKAPLEMFNFITSRRIFPEIGIYRTAALHKAMMSSEEGAYLAFMITYALLKQGHAVFEKEPFYHEVAVTRPEFAVESRMNIDLNLSYLDNLRASVEVTMARILMDMGRDKLPQEMRTILHELLLGYAQHRLGVAFNRALSRHAYIEAAEIAQRLIVWLGSFRPDLPQISHSIYALAGLQAAATLYSASSWLKVFYIHGFKNPKGVEEGLRKFIPDITPQVLDAAEVKTVAQPDEAFVLVKTAGQRELLLEGDIPPGNIVVLEEMAQHFQIMPGHRSMDAL